MHSIAVTVVVVGVGGGGGGDDDGNCAIATTLARSPGRTFQN